MEYKEIEAFVERLNGLGDEEMARHFAAAQDAMRGACASIADMKGMFQGETDPAQVEGRVEACAYYRSEFRKAKASRDFIRAIHESFYGFADKDFPPDDPTINCS